jgi:penicillin amidase
MWNGYIPMDENPHSKNPIEGYLSSANQRAADISYPYFMPGSYEVYRPITINRKLAELFNITIADMQQLQNNNYNVFAEMALPILMKNIDQEKLSTDEKADHIHCLKWLADPSHNKHDYAVPKFGSVDAFAQRQSKFES